MDLRFLGTTGRRIDSPPNGVLPEEYAVDPSSSTLLRLRDAINQYVFDHEGLYLGPEREYNCRYFFRPRDASHKYLITADGDCVRLTHKSDEGGEVKEVPEELSEEESAWTLERLGINPLSDWECWAVIQ